MIIAECAQNYNSIEEAVKLISLAKENGADLAKFQLFDAQKLYGKPNPYELSFSDATRLFKHGQEIGMEVFFSVFDAERVKWCEEMGVKRYKLANRMRDLGVVGAVVTTGKPIISSYEWDNLPNAKFLYCPPRLPYPQPNELTSKDINEIHRLDGFSDHTVGLRWAIYTLCIGKIVEKHLAFDHDTGKDCIWSMTPDELKILSSKKLLAS